MPRGLLYGVLSFIFLVSFSVYLLTLCPTFQPDDSAETVTALVTLSPPHPPGYPLYAFLGHLAFWNPIGNPAFRINLLAAFLASFVVVLTALFSYRLLGDSEGPVRAREDRGNQIAGLLAITASSLTLAFSKTFWSQALSAKGGVYILQALVFLGMAYLVLEMGKASKKKRDIPRFYLYLGLGIGLGTSLGWETQAVFTLAFLLTGIVQGAGDRPKEIPKKVIFTFAWYLIGTSVFLFLPLRSGRADLMIWGHPSLAKGFTAYFTSMDSRQDVGMVFLQNILDLSIQPKDWGKAWVQLSSTGPTLDRLSSHLAWDMGLPALLLALAGFWGFYRRQGKNFLLFGLVTVFFLVVAHGIFVWTEPENIWCLDKFLLPANVFQALCMAVGTKAVLLWVRQQRWGKRRVKGRKKAALLRGWGMAGLVFLLPLFPLERNLFANDQSRQTWAYDHGVDVLRSLKRDALFIPEGDNSLFEVLYFQGVLKRRRDVILIPAFYLWTDWGITEIIQKLPWFPITPSAYKSMGPGQRVFESLKAIGLESKRPIQFSPNLNLLDRCYFSLLSTPDGGKGIFDHLKPFGDSFLWTDREEKEGLELLGLSRNRNPQGREAADVGAMDVLFATEAQAFFNAAEFCASKGQREGTDHYFLTALQLTRNPQLLSRIWQGRGDFWLSLGDRKSALEAFEKSIQIHAEPAGYSKHIRVLLMMGSVGQATEEATETAEKFPGSPNAWRDLAACEGAAGNTPKAEADLQRALQLEGKLNP